MWFNVHSDGLNTSEIQTDDENQLFPGANLIHARTRTTTKMGPAKLQMSVSWTESQQKSGFP